MLIDTEFGEASTIGDCYAVTKDGRVLTRNKHNGMKDDSWRVMKPIPNSKGYERVYLVIQGRRVIHKISRLVLEHFVGPCPDGMECCHNDGNKDNNRLENLRWDTPRNNMLDKINHGTAPYCRTKENDGLCKLTPENIAEIRASFSTFNDSQIAKKYGVKTWTISRIRRGESWRFLEPVASPA